MIRRDAIKLSRRLIVPRAPGLASVEADRRSLIHTEHDSLRIRRIDPDRVVIVATWSALDRCKRAPSVGRAVQVLRRHINNVGVLRVHEYLAHVPEPFDPLVLCRLFPRRSRVV